MDPHLAQAGGQVAGPPGVGRRAERLGRGEPVAGRLAGQPVDVQPGLGALHAELPGVAGRYLLEGRPAVQPGQDTGAPGVGGHPVGGLRVQEDDDPVPLQRDVRGDVPGGALGDGLQVHLVSLAFFQ